MLERLGFLDTCTWGGEFIKEKDITMTDGHWMAVVRLYGAYFSDLQKGLKMRKQCFHTHDPLNTEKNNKNLSL